MTNWQPASTGLVRTLRHGALGQTHREGAGVTQDTHPGGEDQVQVVPGLVPLGIDQLGPLSQPPGHGLADQLVVPVGKPWCGTAETGVHGEGPAVLDPEGRSAVPRLLRDGPYQLIDRADLGETDPHPACDVQGVPELIREVVVGERRDPVTDLALCAGVQRREIVLDELCELPGEVPLEERVLCGPAATSEDACLMIAAVQRNRDRWLAL